MNIRRLSWTSLGALALASAAQAQKSQVVFWEFSTIIESSSRNKKLFF